MVLVVLLKIGAKDLTVWFEFLCQSVIWTGFSGEL